MINISIIMPVYNSEKYLKKAVESILKQSEKNFELILIDDGSSDNSGKICDELAKSDSRIIVIHRVNGGMCASRNQAMDIAKGRYIGFCDNDDEFFENLLKDNLHLADKYNADVVRFSRRMTEIYNGKIISEGECAGYDNRYIPQNEFAEYYEQIKNTCDGVWAGIYKKEFIDKFHIRFDEEMRYGYEDLDFLLKIYRCHPSIVLNKKVYYHWIVRSNHSTSAKMDINNIISLKKCLVQKKKLYEENHMEKRYQYLWLAELADRICRTFTYVSPKKGKSTWKKRKEIIQCFANCEVFPEKFKLKQLFMCIRKKKAFEGLVLYLFINKQYHLLYNMMCIRMRIVDLLRYIK